MNLNKLFRLLVVGGAVLGAASSCGPEEDPGVTSPGDNPLSSSSGGGTEDGGIHNPGTGGGSAALGGGSGGSGGSSANNGGGVGFW